MECGSGERVCVVQGAVYTSRWGSWLESRGVLPGPGRKTNHQSSSSPISQSILAGAKIDLIRDISLPEASSTGHSVQRCDSGRSFPRYLCCLLLIIHCGRTDLGRIPILGDGRWNISRAAAIIPIPTTNTQRTPLKSGILLGACLLM